VKAVRRRAGTRQLSDFGRGLGKRVRAVGRDLGRTAAATGRTLGRGKRNAARRLTRWLDAATRQTRRVLALTGRQARHARAAAGREAQRAGAAVARHPWRAITWALCAVLVMAAAVSHERLMAWAVQHPYFAVDEIVVTPTVRVRSGALLAWTSLKPGISIWSVDPAALGARLERHPWIRRATVRREFPRRLMVSVAEREPAAVVLIDQLYYVDRGGTVVARVGRDDTLDLPFVTGIEAAVLAGERPFPRHAIRQALKLLQSMRAAGLSFRVSEVHIEREQGITVFPVAPRVALVFGWNRFPLKLERLERVLDGFAGRESEIREIDLTYGAQAVIRMRRPDGGGRRAQASSGMSGVADG
jgi:cell division septal protein FtsQ